MSSACSVGIVIVRGGEVHAEEYRLIRPRPNFYTSFNTAIHGLDRHDTDGQEEFPLVWEQIASLVEGLPLVAHNSPFDEGVLRAVHHLYEMPYPDYTFHCTCRASRRVFGRTLPNHKLGTVAAHIGFDLKNHHHALADARACAEIALRLFE